MFRWITTSFQRLIASRTGSVAVQIGVSLVVLIGMAGLGTEGTFLIYKHRQMQAVADSAALSGAMALSQSSPRDPGSEARAVAASLGFVNGIDLASVTVNVPPLSGAYAGDGGAVEVIVAQPQDLTIMRLFGDDVANVGTRSVAIRSSAGRFCILALDPSVYAALYLSNNATVNNPNCGIAVNSTSNSAVKLDNNASIDGSVVTRGEWELSNNAELNGDPLIQHGPLIDDPYKDVQIQPPWPCNETQPSSGKNGDIVSLTPGYFCDGWDFKNNVTLNLAPGAYYIDDKLTIQNNVVVDGTGGVTLIINDNTAIDIKNNQALNITAPTSGDYAGLALMSRSDAQSGIVQKFSNNAVLNIQGAIYFPNQELEIDNNGATNPNDCTHLIARKITLMNNAKVGNNCTGTGVKPIGPPAQLVE